MNGSLAGASGGVIGENFCSDALSLWVLYSDRFDFLASYRVSQPTKQMASLGLMVCQFGFSGGLRLNLSHTGRP